MNGILLTAIMLYCGYSDPELSSQVCLKKQLECAVVNNAYDATEKRATQIVAQCLLQGGKR